MNNESELVRAVVLNHVRFLPPEGHLALSVDIFNGHSWGYY